MAELKATVSHAELVDWAEYYGIEPWGGAPADLRAGIVAATLANCHLRVGADPLTPLDFMPRVKADLDAAQAPQPDQPEKPITPAEHAALRRAVLFGIRPPAASPTED